MSELYTKTKWINNRTKLSAKNMNHIEDGIERVAEEIESIESQHQLHTHPNKQILDQIQVPLTTGLAEKYDSYEGQIEEKSAVSVSETGESETSVQYITIDGVEYKLAGDIAENYEELDNVSLNAITATGVYKIINAKDVPEYTSTSGILNATKLSNDQTAQDWLSTTNRAVRIFDETSVGLKFYVNNEVVPQGEVLLPLGGTYELHGDLLGHIIIGEGELTANNRTKIILNGVNIQSYNYESCIEYTSEASKLIVEIADNSKNYLVAGVEGETGDNDKGALHSENNLVLTGVGYLTIINAKGHGIKASELVITGNPYVYLDTNHDAVHGGKLLKIAGGYFVVHGANDAFSGSAGGNNDGKVLILGGEYNIVSCKEAAFEGKSANGIKKVLNSTITFGEGCNKLFNASNANEGYEFKVFEGLNTITNNSSKTYEEVSLAEAVGLPYLYEYGEEPVQITASVTTLDPSSDKEYVIKGNWTGKKLITAPASGVKVDFRVKDLYYESEDAEDLEAFITHTNDKRIKFSIDEFNLAYIKKAAGSCITTAKNLQVKGKGDLFLSCTNGEAISAPNGYTVLGGDGIRSIKGSASGITTSSLRLGEDPDDVDEKFDTPSKRGVSDTAAYIIENTQDITLTNTEELITYKNQIIATQYMTGAVILGTIQAANVESALVVQSGDVLQKEGEPYPNTALVYGMPSGLIIAGDAHTYIEPSAEELDGEVPDIEEAAGSDWIVYRGDGYTKEEVDTKFVPKTEYNALLAKLDAIAPRAVNFSYRLLDPTQGIKKTNLSFADVVDESGEEPVIKSAISNLTIYKYACPEEIEDEAEQAHKYLSSGAPIYARDGDKGYVAIDKTGQVNFIPEFTEEFASGYVLQPVVTPADGYNNFKTQWNTGIPGLYRFTKVNSDLDVELHAVKESEMPAHVLTYKLRAPVDYPIDKVPYPTIFRGADHLEKYVKYGPGATLQGAYNTLDESLISGCALVLPQEYETVTIDNVDYHEWTIIDRAYDDNNGLPSADTSGDLCASYVRFDGEMLPSYVVSVSATGSYNKLNPPKAGQPCYKLTKVIGDVTIIATVIYDPEPVSLTFVNNTNYAIEFKDTDGTHAITESMQIKGIDDFKFTIAHNLGDEAKTHDPAITSVVIGGDELGITASKTDKTKPIYYSASKKKDECTIWKEFIDIAHGNIIITVNETAIKQPEEPVGE